MAENHSNENKPALSSPERHNPRSDQRWIMNLRLSPPDLSFHVYKTSQLERERLLPLPSAWSFPRCGFVTENLACLEGREETSLKTHQTFETKNKGYINNWKYKEKSQKQANKVIKYIRVHNRQPSASQSKIGFKGFRSFCLVLKLGLTT